MATLILLSMLGAACGAAFVPAVSQPRTTFFNRLRERLSRRPAAAAAYAPPHVIHDSGWVMVQCDDPESFKDWLGRDVEGIPFKAGEPPSLGSHLLVELFDCDGDCLKHETGVGGAMHEAAEVSKATVVAESFHEFKPYGVSGAVIIQESHYTIHTWPEHGYAAVDLFYCGGTVHVQRAIDVLIERFRPQRMKFLVVRRGVQTEVERA